MSTGYYYQVVLNYWNDTTNYWRFKLKSFIKTRKVLKRKILSLMIEGLQLETSVPYFVPHYFFYISGLLIRLCSCVTCCIHCKLCIHDMPDPEGYTLQKCSRLQYKMLILVHVYKTLLDNIFKNQISVHSIWLCRQSWSHIFSVPIFLFVAFVVAPSYWLVLFCDGLNRSCDKS